MLMTDTLHTVAEVLERLKISRQTLYNLINDGKIAPVKIGRSTRFRASEIDRFIREA